MQNKVLNYFNKNIHYTEYQHFNDLKNFIQKINSQKNHPE